MLEVHNLTRYIKFLYIYADLDTVVCCALKSVRRLGHRTDLYPAAGVILSPAESSEMVVYTHNETGRSQLLVRK